MFGGTHTFTHIQTEASRGRPPKDLELGEKLHDDLVDPIPIHKRHIHKHIIRQKQPDSYIWYGWQSYCLYMYLSRACLCNQKWICVFFWWYSSDFGIKWKNIYYIPSILSVDFVWVGSGLRLIRNDIHIWERESEWAREWNMISHLAKLIDLINLKFYFNNLLVISSWSNL